ncbi:MAG: BamA/TamA family outer membrane protein [bacterium]
MRPGKIGVLSLSMLCAGWLSAASALAQGTMEEEEDIAELLPVPFPTAREGEEVSGRQWAVLPQVGFGPDTGGLGGLKFSHRNIDGKGAALDLDATYAMEGQSNFALSLGSPHLLEDKLIVLLRARYRTDPERDFFGLGNNDLGPDPVSFHAIQDIAGALTVGWRPFRRLAFNFAIGARDVEIWCDKGSPCTRRVFGDMPGVTGGTVNYLGLSLVWNNRDSILRPTRGWRLIGKAIHTNQVLLSDYQFTRLVGDASYLRSLFDDKLVLGARINSEWVIGPEEDIPFWELSELGGRDTLRGFFPHRFAGKGRALVNLEARGSITSFDFFDIWRVHIDGVLFGDGGRVFIDRDELRDEFKLNSEIISRVISDLQYSYGGGLRITLSKSLVARIDAGFSEEETGLVYLSFGQTF